MKNMWEAKKSRTEETAAAVEAGDAVQPTNIICIMNESLSDLSVDGNLRRIQSISRSSTV